MPRQMFINQNLKADYKVELISSLNEYIDWFAWNYTEMSGLSHGLVEHRLPIKPGSGLRNNSIIHVHTMQVLTWNGVVNDQHILFQELNKKIRQGLYDLCHHTSSCYLWYKSQNYATKYKCLLTTRNSSSRYAFFLG